MMNYDNDEPVSDSNGHFREISLRLAQQIDRFIIEHGVEILRGLALPPAASEEVAEIAVLSQLLRDTVERDKE